MTRCAKVKYRDRIAAELALAKVKRQDKPHRGKIESRVYRCDICHAWHLTSRP